MSRENGAAFSVPRFRSLLKTSWIGQDLRYQPVVDSTMDLARELAVAGAAGGTVILAEEQTLGRGRFGRRWLSRSGVNLTFSILLYPPIERLQALSMIAPLAVADGIRAACGLECSLKWPNDVQVGDRKLAGILLESVLNGMRPLVAIAGVGINVNYDPAEEPEISQMATSILREKGHPAEREAVLAACLEAFERLYGAPVAEMRERWRSRLSTLGQQVRVSFQGQTEDGLAEDVTEEGSLILRRGDGTRVNLPAGEVSLHGQSRADGEA